MNLRIISPILAMAVLLLSGCILLPVPHEQWLSPRFTGSVADAESGAPLRGVKITLTGYRYAEEEVGAVVAYTDETGRFSVLASKHTNWMPIWLGPAEGVQGGTVVFECDGYVAATEKRSVFTGASGRTAFELAVRMKKKQPTSRHSATPLISPESPIMFTLHMAQLFSHLRPIRQAQGYG